MVGRTREERRDPRPSRGPGRAARSDPDRGDAGRRADDPGRATADRGFGGSSTSRGSRRFITHGSSIGYTASGSQPVFEAQAGDVPKVLGIVRHHGQVVDEACRPDEQVHIVDADSLPPEVGPHASELVGAVGVEG